MCAVPPARTPNEHDRQRKLHAAHLFALRAGPYFIAVVGAYLVLIGTLAGMPEAEAIATTVLGAIACVTAGVVTRADKVEVAERRVKASLTPIRDLDPGEWALAVTTPPEPALAVLPAEPRRLPPGPALTTKVPTVVELLTSAVAAGWSVAQTTGTTHATLTKTNVPQGRHVNAGDTLTLQVPTDRLFDPVPANVWDRLVDAGFPQQ